MLVVSFRAMARLSTLGSYSFLTDRNGIRQDEIIRDALIQGNVIFGSRLARILRGGFICDGGHRLLSCGAILLQHFSGLQLFLRSLGNPNGVINGFRNARAFQDFHRGTMIEVYHREVFSIFNLVTTFHHRLERSFQTGNAFTLLAHGG